MYNTVLCCVERLCLKHTHRAGLCKGMYLQHCIVSRVMHLQHCVSCSSNVYKHGFQPVHIPLLVLECGSMRLFDQLLHFASRHVFTGDSPNSDSCIMSHVQYSWEKFRLLVLVLVLVVAAAAAADAQHATLAERNLLLQGKLFLLTPLAHSSLEASGVRCSAVSGNPPRGPP